MNEWLKARIRRWLQLDGPGGLADVLQMKDGQHEALAKALLQHGTLLGKVTEQVNLHSAALLRFVVYEQEVPSIRRVFHVMQQRAVREQRRRQAEEALAAAPVVEPVDAVQPADAVSDAVSEQVVGG